MTGRGRALLVLGVVVYAVAWGFGSRPLYPVAIGLLLAPLLAWTWVHVTNHPLRVRRGTGESQHREGEDVPIVVELDSSGPIVPPSMALVERVGRLGERRTAVARHGHRFRARYVLEAVPRGRYRFEQSRVEISDPFGLQQAVVELPAPGALLVYPRLVQLDRVFSESGAHVHDGRRLLLRRPAGFDLHSVREYEQGESLRKVHWRSTARRGQLMVKELEDAPRDEIAVLLDAYGGAVAGESFDVQVRAAGSILDAHVRRNRRAVLVVNSATREIQQVHAPTGDWHRALELLAAAEPTATAPADSLLADEAGVAARALELAVVTARLEPALVDRLVQRALGRRSVSLVFVDPASFNGVGPKPQPALLRLQAAGIPLAVVRRGDDLAQKLGAASAGGVAVGQR